MEKAKIHVHICDCWGMTYIPDEIESLAEENSDRFNFEFSTSGSHEIFEFLEQTSNNVQVDIFIISGNYYTTRINFEGMKKLQQKISERHPQAYIIVSSSNRNWVKPALVTGISYTTNRDIKTIKPVWDTILAEIVSGTRTTNGFKDWEVSTQQELYNKVKILEYEGHDDNNTDQGKKNPRGVDWVDVILKGILCLCVIAAIYTALCYFKILEFPFSFF